jgi:uncharacterized protein (TIGR00255 family)
MTLKSMTGYGRGEAAAGGIKVGVELSSVNRKQFDVRINLPRQLIALEARVAELVHRTILRGSVTGTVNIDVSSKARLESASVDMDVAKGYVKAIRKAAAELGLEDDLGARSLLSLPEVVKFESLPADPAKIWSLLEKALGKAIGQLAAMRKTEGKALEKDITGRMKKLKALMEEIKKLAPDVPVKYRELLLQRLENAGIGIKTDDPALNRELALFADRSDVSEEITRLESHFKQAATIIASNEAAGRTLDFLCQEMFREINTIGSKANDGGITKYVVSFKTELECVREQVQNVE